MTKHSAYDLILVRLFLPTMCFSQLSLSPIAVAPVTCTQLTQVQELIKSFSGQGVACISFLLGFPSFSCSHRTREVIVDPSLSLFLPQDQNGHVH